MATVKICIVLLACLVAFAACSPAPFFHHKKHEHYIIHVPYNVHTHNVHHHHIEKVPIWKPYPVIKHIPIYNEVHVPIVKEVAVPLHVPSYKSSHGWENNGWW